MNFCAMNTLLWWGLNWGSVQFYLNFMHCTLGVMPVLEEMGIKLISLDHFGSWDSVVGIATGYELNDRGVGFRVPVG
jgi:hypothetical protein